MDNDPQKNLISIIIPTINKVDLLIKCLDSLLASQPSAIFPYEIIIVDDGSAPEIQRKMQENLKKYPVQVLTQPHNSGFAVTVNKGAELSKGEYICLLNNDVEFIQKNWLDMMMGDMQRPQVGVVGPRLLYQDGRIQHGGIIYLPHIGGFDHEYRNQPGDCPAALRSREVLGVTGAVMLINRYLWNQLGGMDEQYFIGMEDVDFCLRTWDQGWKVYFCGAAVAVHPEGITRGHDAYWRTRGLESCQLFFQKWRRRLQLFERALRPVNVSGRYSVSELQALSWRKMAAKSSGVPPVLAFKSSPSTVKSSKTFSFHSGNH